MADYKAHIEALGDTGLLDLIKSELKETDRSKIAAKVTKGIIIFDITAEDFTALRASVASVMQLIAVYDKMKKIR